MPDKQEIRGWTVWICSECGVVPASEIDRIGGDYDSRHVAGHPEGEEPHASTADLRPGWGPQPEESEPRVRNLAEELNERAARSGNVARELGDSENAHRLRGKAQGLYLAAGDLDNAFPPEVWKRKIERQEARRQRLHRLTKLASVDAQDGCQERNDLAWEIADEDELIARFCPAPLLSGDLDDE